MATICCTAISLGSGLYGMVFAGRWTNKAWQKSTRSVSVRCSQVPSIRARPDEAPRSQEGMAWRRVGALSFRLAASGQTHFVYLSGT